PGGSSRAIPGADALLFYLSSPCKIEPLKFVSSLTAFYYRLISVPQHTSSRIRTSIFLVLKRYYA
ncbi:hypothetical protein DVQ30_05320, partial [Yersinia enterocolitica]|nr:hypothetical protein [Yersinia enterocolitica]